ncbi:hypothetical protein S101446_00875 [Komagataeibacter europaeus]|nr:hypothetical protein S101446_00875 [Komagataeibacter europaeus]
MRSCALRRGRGACLKTSVGEAFYSIGDISRVRPLTQVFWKKKNRQTTLASLRTFSAQLALRKTDVGE